MTHIDQMEDILEELTSYTITQGEIQTGYDGIWIQPNDTMVNTLTMEEVEFYDIIVIESTLALLQTKKQAFLKAKTLLDFNYNDFDARGYIAVADGSLFDLNDTVEGGTSGATGTVFKIVSNTLYLKDVVGVWQSGEAITDSVDSTSSTTSTLMPLSFPYYITNKMIRYDYPVDYNSNVGGDFITWLQFEARWSL